MVKKFVKKLGRLVITLSPKDEKSLRQTVLLIDSISILPNNFALIIRNVKARFNNAVLKVLTFEDKKDFIAENFPEVEVIVPGTKIKKYQLAVQLLSLLRRKPHFIVLSSLDISVTAVALIFSGSPVFLHNRWLEWYRLRQRTLTDLLRGAKSADDYKRRKISRGIKDIIKAAGRSFVILSEIKEEDIKSRILVEDNGYTDTGHISNAIRQTEKFFINPDITILTFPERRQHFADAFPQMKLSIVEGNNNCRLAIQMCLMRKIKFNYIILTALDVSSVIVSFVFFRAKILLYNRWHQWWSLDLRNIWEYFKYICIFLAMVPAFIYLLIASGLILFKTGLRLRFTNLK